jgi:hypothetical protein
MSGVLRRRWRKARICGRAILPVTTLLVAMAVSAGPAWADAAAAQKCAATLPKDGQAIFQATLPQVRPGTDLRQVVTVSTRALVESGRIDRGGARQSAVAAAQCLRLAGG